MQCSSKLFLSLQVVPNNAINPVYDEEPFIIKRVVLPGLASIRIVAYEEGGRFIGHRILPLTSLSPGYRHVNLRTELGKPSFDLFCECN